MKKEQHLIAIDNSPESLLKQGWELTNSSLQAEHLWRVLSEQGDEFIKLGLRAASEALDFLTEKERPVWVGLMGIMSGYKRLSACDRLIAFATPQPELPSGFQFPLRFRYDADYKSGRVKSEECGALGEAVAALKLAVFESALEILGTPDLIYQLYEGVTYSLPAHRFPGWNKLDVIGSIRAYWKNANVWMVKQTDGKYEYLRAEEWVHQLMMPEACDLIRRACEGKVMRVGDIGSSLLEVISEFRLNSFPNYIQEFSEKVQSFVRNNEKTAILVHGKPGVGKTRWVYSMLDEVFIPQGFMVLFIDHRSLASFSVPDWAEKMVVVLNEADNLAEDRSEAKDGSTEAILRLIDSSEVSSLRAKSATKCDRKIIYMMTCNSTERFDPALVREGRLDLILEFDHAPYVDTRLEN